MEKYFRTEWGELVNIVDHTLEQVAKYPSLRIYIGTDSQTFSQVTRYATAIVFRYGQRGAHYIYHLEEVTRMRSEFERLYAEGVRTIEAAEIIMQETPIAIEALEFDYADAKKTLSSKLVSSFKGWCSGINMKPVFKSGEMIATKAADHICRKHRL